MNDRAIFSFCLGQILFRSSSVCHNFERVKVTESTAIGAWPLPGAFHTLAAFIGALRETRSEGAAVLVSSAAARVGTPNHEAVAAAKAGLEGLVRGAAATYAANRIRVNAVAPGIMETPASAGVIASPAARDAAARQYPLPGIGSADELAGLMTWLLSDAAARVTGQIWSLDGGFSSIRPLVK
jgi:NAD(P)-dependent dehydrogenase (short-subunit alcohol dehydrogenase family)